MLEINRISVFLSLLKHSYPFPIHLAVIFFPLLSILGCQSYSSFKKQYGQSSYVLIQELEFGDYEAFDLEVVSASTAEKSYGKRKYQRGSAAVELELAPGSYRFVMDYIKDDEVVYSSRNCPNYLQNDVRKLNRGHNAVSIGVCEPNDAKARGGSFTVRDGQLIDPSGKVFVMRGVNNPHAYFLEQAYDALPQIKGLGFNAVRIVWCADTLQRAGRCEAKDLHPVAELDRVLKRMRELKLVAVLNLQNATGSDKRSDLQAMVSYLLKPEVKQVLNKYGDMLLINVANEWYGSWNKKRDYINAYLDAIPELRKAGLAHTLIVDARGYAQDFSSIPEHAAALMALDQNLMISAHMYDVYADAAAVKNVFSTVRKGKIPFLVGEFACSHGAGKVVACESIMLEAELGVYKIGYLAWSLTGNSPELVDLDVLRYDDWTSLTEWGEKLVQTPLYGIAETSQQACFFDAKKCQ